MLKLLCLSMYYTSSRRKIGRSFICHSHQQLSFPRTNLSSPRRRDTKRRAAIANLSSAPPPSVIPAQAGIHLLLLLAHADFRTSSRAQRGNLKLSFLRSGGTFLRTRGEVLFHPKFNLQHSKLLQTTPFITGRFPRSAVS